MGWTTPQFSRDEVDKAGRTYVNPGATSRERRHALAVINNWRSSHSFPLNTFATNLRHTAGRFDQDRLVAQRIKRLPSIRHKLERLDWLDLSRMQDIGGSRAVLGSVEGVNEVVDYYLTKSQIKHKLVRHDPYINRPKRSGYRGVHLVYGYFSDRKTAYNDLRIELQIRSRLQHAWATAVETVGLFTQQALKSSWGEPDWLRFFALMSSEFAFRERTPIVPGTPNDHDELTDQVRKYAQRLNVVGRLNGYSRALTVLGDVIDEATRGGTFLLELDVDAETLRVRYYTDSVRATEDYAELESQLEGEPGKDVVLVKGESLDSLRQAYPNYFADTSVFVAAVLDAIG
jgi:hypothetical protein